jgi:hypothetical protein
MIWEVELEYVSEKSSFLPIFRTYLEATIAEAPNANRSQSLIVSDDQSGLLAGLCILFSFEVVVESLAHVVAELGPKYTIHPSSVSLHWKELDCVRSAIRVKLQWYLTNSNVVVSRFLQVGISISDDNVRHRLAIGSVEYAANASIRQNVPNSVFLGVINPLRDKWQLAELFLHLQVSFLSRDRSQEVVS